MLEKIVNSIDRYLDTFKDIDVGDIHELTNSIMIEANVVPLTIALDYDHRRSFVRNFIKCMHVLHSAEESDVRDSFNNLLVKIHITSSRMDTPAIRFLQEEPGSSFVEGFLL